MHCNETAVRYATETDPKEKDLILEETLQKIHLENEKRHQELLAFVDDFVSSEEFSEYQKAKENICRCEKYTQYDLGELNSIIIELKNAEKVEEKYPLTLESRKLFAFQEQFEKYAKRKQNVELWERQQRGINTIKDKMTDAKKIFECSKERRQKQREERDNGLLEKYSKKLNIDLTDLSIKTQKIVLERLRYNQETFKIKQRNRRQNVVKIVEKILFERKMKEKEEEIANRTYDSKVRRQERTIEDMEVVGTKIKLIDLSTLIEKPIVEEPIAIEPTSEGEKPVKRTKPEGKPVKNKTKSKNKERSTDKSSRSTKTKKEKTSKSAKGKKKEKGVEKFRLPSVPITNPREKIQPEDLERIVDLIEEFRHFDNTLEDEYLKWQKGITYQTDFGMECKPNAIVFQNFEDGKTYTKTVKVRNISTDVKKCRFEKFLFENAYDEIAFHVECFGIQKLYTGCYFQFLISFKPWDSEKPFDGQIRFVTYSSKACKFYQFDIPLRCVPKCTNVKVYPEVLNFGSLPRWQAGGQETFKIVKISNVSDNQCRVFIHKILDPLDLESIVCSEGSVSSRNSEINSDNSNCAPNFVEDDMKNILDLCLQNLDNYFHFEPSYFTINSREEVRVKVIFKNADYVGNYFEKYVVDVYENVDKDQVITCQEISVLAETTGHFLQVIPECLDFHYCLLDSCYQQSFEVCNNSNHTQAISIKFPKLYAELVSVGVTHFYLPAKSRRTVWLKFIPRKYVLKNWINDLFDEINHILEFNLSLHVVSKSQQNYPPVKLTVFAIMTNSDELAISIPTQAFVSNFLDSIIFDLGLCSTSETITSEIFLVNNSLVPQICGFYDIPECLKIYPNQGFVRLKPNERKRFELFLTPDVKDFADFDQGSQLNRDEFIFRLGVDSVYNIGKIKPELDGRVITNSMDMMLQAMSTSERDTELYECIKSCLSALKKDLHFSNPSQSLYNATSKSVINHDINDLKNNASLVTGDQNQRPSEIDMNLSGSELNYNNFVILETNRRKTIWCKVTLLRPLLEFSHQYVEFPDTPCGSYTVMEISLRALETNVERQCDLYGETRAGTSYSADFKIVSYGTGEEISIEPKCGTLKQGEQIKLMVVARPNIPEEIVRQKARSIKYQDIFERKLEELKRSLHKKGKKEKGGGKKKKKESKKKHNTEEKLSEKSDKKEKGGEKKSIKKTEKSKTKGKKDKNKNIESTEESATEQPNLEQDIVINEKELECDYLDLYPAEMVHWRNMEAYYIKANFVCHINYEKSKELRKKKEKIYLEALCKVVRPDFKTNLSSQRIDFGKCVIGMDSTKMIYLQNIKYKKIAPKFSTLNPVGSFGIPFFRNLNVPPEHTLNIPLKFAPEKEGLVTEYFEIRSGATVLPLILNGEGVSPILQVIPQFSVYRLEAKKKKLGEMQFTLANHSESTITVLLNKVFELDGIVDLAKLIKQDENDKSGEKNYGKKDKKPRKDTKLTVGKDKSPKFSDELVELEKEAIEAFFKKTEEPSYFETSVEENFISIEPDQQKSIKIFFGDPQLLEKQRAKKDKKKKKEKLSKKEKISDKDNKTKKKKDGNSSDVKKENKDSKRTSEPSTDKSSKKSEESGKSKKGNKLQNQHIVQYNIFVGKTFVKNIILVCTLY